MSFLLATPSHADFSPKNMEFDEDDKEEEEEEEEEEQTPANPLMQCMIV